MTDESLQADRQHEQVRPEIRASDLDRERAVETLRAAAGDGRLTSDEFEGRLGLTLTARTTRDLSVLTADLPEVGGISAGGKDVVRVDVQGGKTARRGRWIVPRRMEVDAVGGSITLDFTDAVISHPTLSITAEVRGGRLLLVTRQGIEVDVDDVAARGGRVKVRPERGLSEPACLIVTISGEAHGGEVIVRPRRPVHWRRGRRRSE